MLSFVYLSPVFLYFPRFLPSVETQPLLAAGIALLSVLFGRNRRALLGFGGLALMLLVLVAIRLALGSTFGDALRLIPILIGPLILFGALAMNAKPPSRGMIAAVSVYFIMSAVFEIFEPGAYADVTSELLSRSHVTDGHRGVSLFTPEPTYAAISVIYFLMLALWSGRYWGFRYRWVEFTLVLCLILTGSTYVVLLLLALAYVRWPRLMILGTAIAIITAPLIRIISLDNDESIRVVVAASRLLSSDFSNLLPSLSIADSSLGSRLITNIASFLTPLHSPLGLGLDCLALPRAFDAAGFDFAYDNPVLRVLIDGTCLKPQSYAASVALGFGALSVIFVFLFVGLTIYASGQKRLAVWAPPLSVATVLLVVQGQLTSPIPWLLIFFALRGLPRKMTQLSTVRS